MFLTKTRETAPLKYQTANHTRENARPYCRKNTIRAMMAKAMDHAVKTFGSVRKALLSAGT